MKKLGKRIRNCYKKGMGKEYGKVGRNERKGGRETKKGR